MTTNFETPSQLAKRVGVPVANIRSLINQGLLDHIYLTPRKTHARIPSGSWERYVEKFMIKAREPSPEYLQGEFK